MPHFFIQSTSVNGDNIIISDKDNYNHIARALRARVGEKLLLIDENAIQYETVISSISSDSIVVKVVNHYKSARNLDFELYLAQSPLRSDAQNLVIEKATELGVTGVYPIYTDNCALNKSVIEKKIEKWQKIMYESSKQCERACIPTCYNLTTIDKLLDEVRFDRIIAFCERCADMTLREYCSTLPIKKNDKVLIIIGPEGGFSEREFEYFRKNDDTSMLTLGNLILRAETAVTVALGNVIYEYENYK